MTINFCRGQWTIFFVISPRISLWCVGRPKERIRWESNTLRKKGYTVNYYPANWKLYGKRAGFLRNEQMAQNADALVAFWNGESRGTKNMIELAKRYGLKMRIKQY